MKTFWTIALFLAFITTFNVMIACTEGLFDDIFVKQYPPATSSASSSTASSSSEDLCGDDTTPPYLMDCSTNECEVIFLFNDISGVVESKYTIIFSENITNIDYDTVYLKQIYENTTLEITAISESEYELTLLNFDPAIPVDIILSDRIQDACKNTLPLTTLHVAFMPEVVIDSLVVTGIEPVTNIERRDGYFMDILVHFDQEIDVNSTTINFRALRLIIEGTDTVVQVSFLQQDPQSLILRTLNMLTAHTTYQLDFTMLKENVNQNATLANGVLQDGYFPFTTGNATGASIPPSLSMDSITSYFCQNKVVVQWFDQILYQEVSLVYWSFEGSFSKLTSNAITPPTIESGVTNEAAYTATLDYIVDAPDGTGFFKDNTVYYFYITYVDADGIKYESDLSLFNYLSPDTTGEGSSMVRTEITPSFFVEDMVGDPGTVTIVRNLTATFHTDEYKTKTSYCWYDATLAACDPTQKIALFDTISMMDHAIPLSFPLDDTTINKQYVVEVYFGDICGDHEILFFNIDTISPKLSDSNVYMFTPEKTIVTAQKALDTDTVDTSLTLKYGLEETSLTEITLTAASQNFQFELLDLVPGTRYMFSFHDPYGNQAVWTSPNSRYALDTTGKYTFYTAITNDPIYGFNAVDNNGHIYVTYDKTSYTVSGYHFCKEFNASWMDVGSLTDPMLVNPFYPSAMAMIDDIPYIAYLTNNADADFTNQSIAVVKWNNSIQSWEQVGLSFDLALCNVQYTGNFMSTYIESTQQLSLTGYKGQPLISFLEKSRRMNAGKPEPISVGYDAVNAIWITYHGNATDFIAFSGGEFTEKGKVPVVTYTNGANTYMFTALYEKGSTMAHFNMFKNDPESMSFWMWDNDILSASTQFTVANAPYPAYPYMSYPPYTSSPEIEVIQMEIPTGTDDIYIFFSVTYASTTTFYVGFYDIPTKTWTDLPLPNIPTTGSIPAMMKLYDGNPYILWMGNFLDDNDVSTQGIHGLYYDGTMWQSLNRSFNGKELSLVPGESITNLPLMVNYLGEPSILYSLSVGVLESPEMFQRIFVRSMNALNQ